MATTSASPTCSAPNDRRPHEPQGTVARAPLEMNEDPDPPDFDIAVVLEDPAWAASLADAEELTRRAAAATLEAAESAALLPAPPEVSVVLASDARVRALNRDYRGSDRPTNVLSFAHFDRTDVAPGPEGAPLLLGDVVLARETLLREAGEQGKRPDHHLIHLVVHGVLHLLGYDHQDDGAAIRMEALERRILAALGVPDPYRTVERAS